MRKFLLFPITGLIFILFLSGCATSISMPMSAQRVIPDGVTDNNFDTFLQTMTSLKERVKIGERLTKKEVLGELNIIEGKTSNVFYLTTAEEKYQVMYGPIQIQMTPEQAERHRGNMERTEIVGIPWINTYSPVAIQPLKVKATFHTEGPLSRSYLIFKDTILVSVLLPNKPRIDEDEDRYLPSVIPNVAGGSANQAGKRLIQGP